MTALLDARPSFPHLPAGLARAAVDRVVRYPFKIWGFGEDIALRALLEHSEVTGDPAGFEFVEGLVRPWCEAVRSPTFADHVAPGASILALHAKTGQPVYLNAARRLADLHRSFPSVDGIPVHRSDLAGLGSLIWVDCLAMDGPFLTELASLAGAPDLKELAVRSMRAYTAALFDERAGLFRHGYDVEARRRSDCNWARGNGWAMHGLVDTLEHLPDDEPAFEELQALLTSQVAAVIALQSDSGLWHTILDDSESPLENSTAALFAAAILKARRLGLMAEGLMNSTGPVIERAVAALLGAVDGSGGTPVSYATPVGTRGTYVEAPLGVFPWGQGPLILTFTELARASAAASPTGAR